MLVQYRLIIGLFFTNKSALAILLVMGIPKNKHIKTEIIVKVKAKNPITKKMNVIIINLFF